MERACATARPAGLRGPAATGSRRRPAKVAARPERRGSDDVASAHARKRESRIGGAAGTGLRVLAGLAGVHLGLSQLWLGELRPARAIETTSTAAGAVGRGQKERNESGGLEKDRKNYVIRVGSLRGSASPRWLQGFRSYMRENSRYQNVNARLYLRRKVGQGYEDLQDFKLGKVKGRKAKKRCSDDLTTLGDAWLESAIQGGCVQPIIGAELTEWWSHMPEKCKSLVSRDRSGRPGQSGGRGASSSYVWGVPYKWGCLCMLVRQDKLDTLQSSGSGFVLGDWQDLWHPSLKGKIAIPNSPRLLVELTLRSMGKAEVRGESEVREFRDKLQRLRGQVKTFSTEDALKSMKSQQTESELSEQVYVTVDWSHNLLPFSGKSNKLKAYVPNSGTLLTADCWCIPHCKWPLPRGWNLVCVCVWLTDPSLSLNADALPSSSTGTIVDKWLSYTTSGIGGPAGGDLDERRSTGLKRGSADIALLAKLEREAAERREAGQVEATAAEGLALLDSESLWTPPCEAIERSNFVSNASNTIFKPL